MNNRYKGKKIALSGGFDPVHVGHVRMFNKARELVGEEGEVVVILNCDDWLVRKKGRAFMNQDERAEVIGAFASVDSVYIHQSDDDHIIEALKVVKPDIFGNGGDRRDESDIAESAICKELGIEMIFELGGNKVQSSSWLLDGYGSKT